MASAGGLPPEEHFLCPICMDVFTEPVTIPCGHNFCRGCIARHWDTNARRCPLCKEPYGRRPKASVNTFISEMVQRFRSHRATEEYQAKTEAEIRRMIQERRAKILQVRRSAELSGRDADAAAADGGRVFAGFAAALIGCVQRSRAEFLRATEEKRRTREKRAEGFVRDLQQEIAQLEKRSSELKRISHPEDHLHLLQNVTCINTCTAPPTKDWTALDVRQSSSCVGTVRTAVSQLEKTLGQEMEEMLSDVELRRVRRYAVDVTLDPDTAYCELILSKDGKQVHHGVRKRKLPSKHVRFSNCVCVLGRFSSVSSERFSSGRFYYEVQVNGKTAWDLGVAREFINRKGQITLNPTNGYWTIGLMNGNQYEANADPSVLLHVREKLQTVGVFVDYEEGLVSFYDVEARVLLYSFTGCSFTERLYPYFYPGLNDGGINSAPLIISPVNVGADLGEDGGNMKLSRPGDHLEIHDGVFVQELNSRTN